jgi:hypothetical protein
VAHIIYNTNVECAETIPNITGGVHGAYEIWILLIRDRENIAADNEKTESESGDRVAALESRIETLEDKIARDQQQESNLKVTRRGLLAAGGVGALGLGALGNVSAGSNQVGIIGTQNDRVDLFAEDIDVSGSAKGVSSLDYTPDANSPFNVSGSIFSQGSIADTSKDIYLLSVKIDSADGFRTSNASGNVYNYVNANGNKSSSESFIPLNGNPTSIAGEILINTNVDDGHIMSFNLSQKSTPPKTVLRGSNSSTGDFTSFSFLNISATGLSGTVEVYGRDLA